MKIDVISLEQESFEKDVFQNWNGKILDFSLGKLKDILKWT